jgi:hypothetical protein
MFSRSSKTFTITSQPYYDQYNQCYKNILTVNIEPQGPIQKIVRQIRFPKLSPFQRESPCNPIPKCGLALQSINNYNYNYNYGGCNCLMTPNEIPDLISFLIENGYQIETQITNMLNQSDVKISDKKIAFTVTYYGEHSPNITYMR